MASCSVKNNDLSQKTIISGKVVNFDRNNLEVTLSVNRPGLGQESIVTQLDSTGNFIDSIDLYIPTDLWIQYKTNFLVLIHPGDSINVVFDGESWQRPEILQSIQFSGDATSTNQAAAKFQQMYFSSSLYSDWDAKAKANKEYNIDQYVCYLDTMQQRNLELLQNFIYEVSPNEETRVWAQTFIGEDYYDALSFYPDDHLRTNNLKRDEWAVPVSYFNPLLKRLPVTESMLISGYALSSFVNRYHYKYAINNVRDEIERQKLFPDKKNMTPAIWDSLLVHGIIKYTPDTLLRQLVLAEHFSQRLQISDVSLFDKYKSIVDTHIQEPFLKKPLYESYNRVKSQIENPQIASDAILKQFEGTSVDKMREFKFQVRQLV